MNQSMKCMLDVISSIPLADTINYLKIHLPKSIKVIYEKDNECAGKINRIMLINSARSGSFCFSGIVLHLRNDRYVVVSVPSPPPINRYDADLLRSRFTDETDIIVANNGTTVTMYWLKDKWVISTHRGLEVNDYYIPSGNKKYKDALNEVLSTYPDFSYDKLQKNKSYTIGFNHSDFHMFREHAVDNDQSKEYVNRKAWFIQSSDCDMFNNGSNYISNDEYIGIPLQKTIRFKSIDDLFDSANNAYEEYCSVGTINYGYIFRIGLRTFLVESSLLHNIRKIFYTGVYKEIPYGNDVNKYITVRSFLDKRKCYVFANLFPQYDELLCILNSTLKSVVNKVFEIVNIQKTGITFNPKKALDKLALCIKNSILFSDKNIFTKRVDYSYIYNYARDPCYANAFYDILNDNDQC